MSTAGLGGGPDGTVEDAPTDAIPPARHAARPRLARAIRTFAIPIVLAWIAIVAILNTTVPQRYR
jgi:RND superfamily putative drug exporter